MKNLVIIPTYNEMDNIRSMIDKVFSLAEPFDLLIIDDGSPDGTAQVVKEMQSVYAGLHLIERAGKQGLGTAYLTGFRWALDNGYDYVFEMDCDFSHNPDDLVRLLHTAVNEGADLVIGSRYIKGVNVVNWPMKRLLMSYYASAYVRMATGMPVRDATAGFVCYSSRLLRTIDMDAVRMKGYGFQVEMKYTSWKLGFKIKEVSIVFTERTLGASKMSGGIFREAFFGVMKLRFRKIAPKQA